MGRDWECHLYFPHQPLTAALAGKILTAMARLDLAPNLSEPDASAYPTLGALASDASGVRVTASDEAIELLLRTKPPPLGPGYGVIPLRCTSLGSNGADAFLTFGRIDPTTGLDSLSLTVDGGAFVAPGGSTNTAAFESVFRWFAVLAELLNASYGWGDWEDIWFSVALPSRTQVAAGVIHSLFRLNCFGPALVEQIGRSRFATLQARVEALDHGAIVVGVGLVYQERATEQRAETASRLGLHPVGGWTG